MDNKKTKKKKKTTEQDNLLRVAGPLPGLYQAESVIKFTPLTDL